MPLTLPSKLLCSFDLLRYNDSTSRIFLIHGLFGGPWSTWAAKSKAGDTKTPSTTIIHPPGLSPDEEQPRLTPSIQTSTPMKLEDVVLWPKDLLPKRIPNARIYTFGYNADGRKFMSSPPASLNSIHQYGHSLLNELSNLLDEQ